jgi:hypothetical protein
MPPYQPSSNVPQHFILDLSFPLHGAFASNLDMLYDLAMVTTPEMTAFDRGVRPILQIVLLDKADTVLNFRPDPALLDRIEELATKSTEGELTFEERAEYEGYIRANKFIAILKRQARHIVDNDSGDE